MLNLLFDYFYDLFHDALGNYGYDFEISISGTTGFTLTNYLTLICGLISLFFIVVLSCLFIYKIIKTIGRLFSGGTL